MTTPTPSPSSPPAGRSLLSRIAASVLIAFVLFGLLWYTVFNAVTAALVASGGTVVLLAGASASDAVETIFELIASIVLGIFSAIGAFFSSLFDWG
jgi:hypothetical protein